jgi:APA family basic amino acid/polyamine antiporter
MAEARQQPESTTVAPRRHVSVTYVVMVAVAMVVGAGIFRSPADIAAGTGSPLWFFGAWLAGGLITLTGALCFAELATMLPSAGGDYHFLKTTYGRHLAFLFAWSRFAVINTGSLALLGFVLGDYANSVWSLGPHGASWYALLTVVAMTLFNLKGLYIGRSADYAMTGLEVGGLVVVFAAGVALVIAGAPPQTDSATQAGFPPGFGQALLFVLFAFSGWSEITTLSAEVSDARRGMVRALTLAVVTITLLYLIANWALWRGLGMEGLGASRTPAADVIRLAFGNGAGVLTALAITMATLTSINATIVVGARTTYAAAADWPRLAFLGHWNSARGIPVAGIVSQGVVGVLLIGLGTFTRDGFATMIDYTSPVFWTFLTLSGFAVLLLRWRRPDLPRPFRVPFFPVLPLLFCASCLFVLWSSLQYVRLGALVGLGVLAAGGVALLWLDYPRRGISDIE